MRSMRAQKLDRAPPPGAYAGIARPRRDTKVEERRMRAMDEEAKPDTQRPPPMAPTTTGRTVLIADDEVALAQGVARALVKAGYDVELAHDGNKAISAIMARRFDVILSDIHMPGTSGVELLRVVRAYDLDVPVILMTGEPEVSTAVEAIELGALLYLCKPVPVADIVAAVDRGRRLHEMARLKRDAMRTLGLRPTDASDRAGLSAGLDRAMASMTVALQPIVSVNGRRIVAHEALLRSTEPMLANPPAVIGAAERLGRLHEVGRLVRRHAAEALRKLPEPSLLFVNLHPQDLLDPELADPRSPLGRVSDRVVLEITERAPLDDVPEAGARVSILRYMGYRFALDDLGAGNTGLGGFARCEPDFVKLDMSLVRDIELSEPRQRLVRGLVSLCEELRSTLIAEGVETDDEYKTFKGLGCDLMQGYLFARPAAEPPPVHWP
jgi:EAL domain-containing protein (putative c-di-GMP-specific phosphodiesterase class I)